MNPNAEAIQRVTQLILTRTGGHEEPLRDVSEEWCEGTARAVFSYLEREYGLILRYPDGRVPWTKDDPDDLPFEAVEAAAKAVYESGGGPPFWEDCPCRGAHLADATTALRAALAHIESERKAAA